MADLDAVFAALDAEGLVHWRTPLEPLLAARLADGAHGDLSAWRDAIERLPRVERRRADLRSDAITVTEPGWDAHGEEAARDALLKLTPWRKGPFRIGGVHIDSEWRSNLKWDRIERAITPLTNRRILDVGAGNGYYALRMRGAGARAVIGIDPTLLYVFQYQAIAHFMASEPVYVLPLRLDELPPRSRAFDTVFSMGVLYHQRSPLEHLKQLADALRPGGELVIETLILPDERPLSRTPPKRYARMRNVWHLPSLAELRVWIERSGLVGATVADVTATTVEEQRSTEWMPFESFREALDPNDPQRTVEGWPAPVRAAVVCRARD